eukprot:TRINITY_DN4045_c0_g1_i1.p1 TRINITY_DN4045_c0_g1~~TRINITY_DN4045_c0_g1_i1.p1  ORF type:complete len:358 (+),score=41.67 TRINITY_DN4045_c0_g1_i1:161-1075(+)
MKKSFLKMESMGFFQHDVVFVERWTSTVRRVAVGEPGSTYDYLGLRVFVHPWEDEECLYDEDERKCLESIKLINSTLKSLAMKSIKEEFGTQDHEAVKGIEWNVVLVNYINLDSEPVSMQEPYYGMGRQLISWHKDTYVEQGSTIGVYNYCDDKDDNEEWGIGLKKAWDVDTPALLVHLKSGDSYFMLYNFNEEFRHTVIALPNSKKRFSSTHRKAHLGSDTWSYIQEKSSRAVGFFTGLASCIDVSYLTFEKYSIEQCIKIVNNVKEDDFKECTDVYSLLENDWIRQVSSGILNIFQILLMEM